MKFPGGAAESSQFQHQKSVQCCIRVHWSFKRAYFSCAYFSLNFRFARAYSGGRLDSGPLGGSCSRLPCHRTLHWLTDFKTISAKYSWKWRWRLSSSWPSSASPPPSPPPTSWTWGSSRSRGWRSCSTGWWGWIFAVWIRWEIIGFTFLFWASDFPRRQKDHKDALKKKAPTKMHRIIFQSWTQWIWHKKIFLGRFRHGGAGQPRPPRGGRWGSRGLAEVLDGTAEAVEAGAHAIG